MPRQSLTAADCYTAYGIRKLTGITEGLLLTLVAREQVRIHVERGMLPLYSIADVRKALSSRRNQAPKGKATSRTRRKAIQ